MPRYLPDDFRAFIVNIEILSSYVNTDIIISFEILLNEQTRFRIKEYV